MRNNKFVVFLKKLRDDLKSRNYVVHDIDKQYGIETSKPYSFARILTGEEKLDRQNRGYAASQPAIIRKAIETLGNVAGAGFVDLGCGKGRVLVVASEFPFARIVGVDLSEALCRIAEGNAAIIRRKFPERPPIELVNGNAAVLPVFEEKTIVVFLYNSFGETITRQLSDGIRTLIESAPDKKVFLIYYNPVHSGLFDDNPALERFSAELHRIPPQDVPASNFRNDHESVVIYQSRTEPMVPALEGADRPVRVTAPEWSADVVMD